MCMEKIKPRKHSEDEFIIESGDQGDQIELRKATPNPEAYRGCVVEAMLVANIGSIDAHNAIETTIVDRVGRDLAMSCGRCGITLVRDNGIVYGATKCPKVQSGQVALRELA